MNIISRFCGFNSNKEEGDLDQLCEELEKKSTDLDISKFSRVIFEVCHDVDKKQASNKERECVHLLKEYLHDHDLPPEAITSDEVAIKILGATHISDLPDSVMSTILSMLPHADRTAFGKTSTWARPIAKDSNKGEAVDRLNELKDIQNLFIKILKGLNGESHQEALELLKKQPDLLEENPPPNYHHKSEEARAHYYHILKALTLVNDKTLDILLEKLRNVGRENRHKPIYYNTNWKEARNLFKALLDRTIEIKHYEDFEDTVRKMAGVGLFNEALLVAQEIQPEEGKIDPYCHIAIELARVEDFDSATLLLKDITDEFSKNLARCNIATEMAKWGAFEGAIALVEDIDKDYPTYQTRNKDHLNILNNRNGVLLDIAIKKVRSGLYNDALNLVGKILGNDQADAYHKIIIEMAREKDFEGAIALAKNIISDGPFKDHVLCEIAIEMAKKGEFKEAEKFIKNLPKRDQDDFYYEMAIEKHRVGHTGEVKYCKNKLTKHRQEILESHLFYGE